MRHAYLDFCFLMNLLLSSILLFINTYLDKILILIIIIKIKIRYLFI